MCWLRALCLCRMRVTSLHLKFTWTLFMSDFMECNPKTSKASARHGSGLSVWRITPLIMCGATGMTHIQIMLRGCPYLGSTTRCHTSTWDSVRSPCSREEMETGAFFLSFQPTTGLSGIALELTWLLRDCKWSYTVVEVTADLYVLMWQMLQSENVTSSRSFSSFTDYTFQQSFFMPL